MNTVERIKSICKERKIPISTLEKECKFSNGYIGQLRKGTMPDDKLIRVATYLSLSMQYLSTGAEETAPQPQSTAEHIQLISLYEKLTDEQKQAILTIMSGMVK